MIIPVYNASQWLEACINSVQLQTLKEIEILCIDDGSTDGSGYLLEKLSKEDSRLRIFKQCNQGAGIARNVGIDLAKGEYIAFLDADDYLLDINALAKMYQACKKQHMEICGAFRCIDRNGNVSKMDIHRSECKGFLEGRRCLYSEYQYDYHYQNYIYSRRLILTNKITFPNYRRFQDPPFFVKAMIAAKEFYVVPIEYYCFRSGHQNYNFNKQKVNDIVKGLTDNLEISAREELKQLHVLTVERFNNTFYWDILQQLKCDNIELPGLLVEANRAVRWEWVDRNEKTELSILKPLQFLMDAGEQYAMSMEEQLKRRNKYGWLFPFQRIQSGARIVLYAAGNVGQAYYQQLKARLDYKLVLWVDRNGEEIVDLGLKIATPDKIQEVEYDVIVIAVEEHRIAKVITEDLIKYGVKKEKIIWGNECKQI